MTVGPARGLPPRIYLPILALTMLVFLSVIGYFLKIGLGVEGAALGPSAHPAGHAALQRLPLSAPRSEGWGRRAA